MTEHVVVRPPRRHRPVHGKVAAGERLLATGHGSSLSVKAVWSHEDPWRRTRTDRSPEAICRIQAAGGAGSRPGAARRRRTSRAHRGRGRVPLHLSVVDGNRVRPLPMLLGHEAAGVVRGRPRRCRRTGRTAAGDDVSAQVRRLRRLATNELPLASPAVQPTRRAR